MVTDEPIPEKGNHAQVPGMLCSTHSGLHQLSISTPVSNKMAEIMYSYEHGNLKEQIFKINYNGNVTNFSKNFK